LKRSNRLVLLIGVFLAVVAFVGIVVFLGGDGNGRTTTATPPSELPTVIAARDIALGVRVTEDMLTTQPLPVDQRNPGAFQAISQVIGQTARQPITSGAQITPVQFTDAPGAVSIEVPPGQRAIAVQVDQVSGVGTLIKTGDYVDLVLGLSQDAFPVVTINPEDETITVVAGLNSTSVKLLIEGIQVIETLLPPPVAQPQQQRGASPAANPGTNLQEGQQEIVILSVSAQQAELIKFAQMDGDISLALRSAADFVDENGEPVVSLPAGTTGVVLKTLVDGGYGVLRPELVEAIIPAQ
jgi:pilus assembly protein CpaB